MTAPGNGDGRVGAAVESGNGNGQADEATRDKSYHYGATPDEWSFWPRVLGGCADLLPCVSNTNAEISPLSKLKQLGKVPSRYSAQRQAGGFPNWTSYTATPDDVAGWRREPDYGICLNTRRVRAIDVDIDHAEEAAAVRTMITQHLGPLPLRYRRGSHKFLMLVQVDTAEDLRKRVIRTKHGAIEFLATGQQCVVAGTHPSGVRYEWEPFTRIPTVAINRFFAP
jgi:hypothetical protein